MLILEISTRIKMNFISVLGLLYCYSWYIHSVSVDTIYTVKIKSVQRGKHFCNWWLMRQKCRSIFVLIVHHTLVFKIFKFSAGKKECISSSLHLGKWGLKVLLFIKGGHTLNQNMVGDYRVCSCHVNFQALKSFCLHGRIFGVLQFLSIRK